MEEDTIEQIKNLNEGIKTDQNVQIYKSSTQEFTSKQKMLISIFFGILFAFFISPLFMNSINQLSINLGGIALMDGKGVNLAGILLSAIFFTFTVRLILW